MHISELIASTKNATFYYMLLYTIVFNTSMPQLVPLLVLGCFMILFVIAILLFMMPGVKCPRCLERGIHQWVLEGKCCPRCFCPC